MPPKAPYQLTPEQLALQEERKRQKAAKQAALATAAASADPAQSAASFSTGKNAILVRQWLRKRAPNADRSSITIMSWNMLAQSLVRRELFPSSDCLKGSQREGMLSNEILAYSPQIACLQEVDRLDKLLPPLHRAGYAHTYAAGRGKKHGCMIIHKTRSLEKVHEKTVYFDEAFLHDSAPSTANGEGEEDAEALRKRRGSSRKTKNIALIVALKQTDAGTAGEGNKNGVPGYIVATCHLFWHPQYIYERVRQGAILLRELAAFRQEHKLHDWPILLAGDFNSQPSEALYSLLAGSSTLTETQVASIDNSRIIHATLDPSLTFIKAKGAVSRAAIPSASATTSFSSDAANPTPAPTAATMNANGNENWESETPVVPPTEEVADEDGDADDGEGEGEGGDPDRVLTNVRPCTPADGLLTASELVALFTQLRSSSSNSGLGFVSAYDSAWQGIVSAQPISGSNGFKDEEERAMEARKIFAHRPAPDPEKGQGVPPSSLLPQRTDVLGANEPMYTSFTHYWRLTLDYIFFAPPASPLESLQKTPEVVALLRTHDAANLEPGLPKRSINASDHVALCAEIEFSS